MPNISVYAPKVPKGHSVCKKATLKINVTNDRTKDKGMDIKEYKFDSEVVGNRLEKIDVKDGKDVEDGKVYVVIETSLSTEEKNTLEILTNIYNEQNYSSWINRATIAQLMVAQGLGTTEQVHSKLQKVFYKSKLLSVVSNESSNGLLIKRNDGRWSLRIVSN